MSITVNLLGNTEDMFYSVTDGVINEKKNVTLKKNQFF